MSGERWKRRAAVGFVVIGLVSSYRSLIGAFSLETGGYEAPVPVTHNELVKV